MISESPRWFMLSDDLISATLIFWGGWNETLLLHQGRQIPGAFYRFQGAFQELVISLFQLGDSLFLGFHANSRSFFRKYFPIVHRGQQDGPHPAYHRSVSQRLSSSKTHLISDRGCPDIQRAPENAGETQGVIDLVREIGSACGNDPGASFLGHPGPDLGDGVGAAENDRIVSSCPEPIPA